MKQEKFARVCSATGRGMNEGYCFGDGEEYFINENDAYDYALSIGYKGLQDAFDDDAYYYTEWNVEDDDVWYDAEGNEYSN